VALVRGQAEITSYNPTKGITYESPRSHAPQAVDFASFCITLYRTLSYLLFDIYFSVFFIVFNQNFDKNLK